MRELPFLFFGFTLGYSFALLLLMSTRWGMRWMQRVLKHAHGKHDQKIDYT